MRWFKLVLLCAVFGIVCAEPEPKKYKPEIKPKIKETNTSLTEEERKFLREVEAKFGIKSDIPVDKDEVENSSEEEDDDVTSKPTDLKLPFPAVIAIEIVNDTDTKSKGKRTIDANLGYGYRTNEGYTYTYLGKSGQSQGKFMIYPYSQQDIPPASSSSSSHSGYPQQSGKTTKLSPNVEITPSQAYELVPAKDEEEPTSYSYEKPAVQLKTNYENIHSVESPPPPYPGGEHTHSASPPSTLYTTYNGEQFSSLSGQFPKVMSNYLVDPSQLLNNPTYQNAGLTQDHLRPHGANLEQRVVPVLVLRIPSSYIKDPSAELYSNLPQNYPLSQYLNNVNLQELVNQYFKKIGYPYAPKVMTYPSSPLATPESSSSSSSVSGYEPQHYASPYVQPSYTHADYSGVQYSAVQPVMAKYPSGYSRQQYYVMRPQSLYQHPQQQYVYRYRYVPQTTSHAQNYYVQPHYQHQQYQQQEIEQSEEQQPSYDTSSQVEYSQQHQPATSGEENTSVEYETPHSQNVQQEYEQTEHVTTSYERVEQSTPRYENTNEVTTPDYGPTKVPLTHSLSHSVQVQYEQPTQKETIAVFPRSQTGHKATAQSYIYQKLTNDHSGSENLVLSENYPSKDHTIATVLPLSYKRPQQHTETVQSVSYVTPIPTMKYHSHYRVMVPQTILRRPTNEKVSYVNSHSISSAFSHLGAASQYNPEEEYTTGTHYVPALSKQKPSPYPRNYHAHPKRMARPENKSDSSTTSRKNERSEKKKSS